MPIPKLTIDTNLLLEYWKQQNKREHVERLLGLAKLGKIDLAVTARIREDIPSDPLVEMLRELPALNIDETGTVMRLDYGMIDRDILADEDFTAFEAMECALAKQSGRRPPDWRDWDHLHAHYLLQRDVFLTWDKGILCLSDDLATRFGIIVMRLGDYLQTMGISGVTTDSLAPP